ncbi:hypothetical protein EDB89DRAFT_1910568 [Lactarius sanguifluus]|nr:hypothetical protein EDB89DRAFT_1910568 [Lactarius sanguifluus]
MGSKRDGLMIRYCARSHIYLSHDGTKYYSASGDRVGSGGGAGVVTWHAWHRVVVVLGWDRAWWVGMPVEWHGGWRGWAVLLASRRSRGLAHRVGIATGLRGMGRGGCGGTWVVTRHRVGLHRWGDGAAWWWLGW